VNRLRFIPLPINTSHCVGGDIAETPPAVSRSKPARPTATDLLETAGALLSRTHLRELGLERRAVDAVFRALPVVVLPGYSRPLVRVADYLELVEQSTYSGNRVR
jgi:hypothetical protein